MQYVLEIREDNRGVLLVSNSNSFIEPDIIPFCNFDITTILGDVLEDAQNGLFEFVKANGGRKEHFDGIRKILATFFYEGDFSVRKIENLMALYHVPFPMKKGSSYTSNCNSLECVVLSVLHYLILSGYKFTRCKHCGRIYATQSLKIVYCKRNSTFPGYERYSCKDAVKHINDMLEKRRKSIYNQLYSNANSVSAASSGYDRYTPMNDFTAKCETFKQSIKKNASIENIKAYSEFLNGELFPKRYARVKGAE